MPGYIIHLSEAEMIMEALQKKGFTFDETWKNLFRLGSILPDTKRKREKVTSHFWSEASLENQAIPPVVKDFEDKYKNGLFGPLMYGYWAHLKMDADYVNLFWPKMLKFVDEKGNEKIRSKDIRYVFLSHTKERILLEDFFSGKYYYGDFDRTNHFLYEKYHVVIPKMSGEIKCPVEEVNIEDLKGVLAELEEMIGRCPP